MAWAPPYCTTAELASWLGVPNEGTELALAIESASRTIDKHCGRQFVLLSSSEFHWYSAEWFKDRWIVPIDDLMTDTNLAIEVDNDQDGTPESEVTAYRLTPINAAAKGQPWTLIEILPTADVKPNGLPKTIRVSARWGWTTVPTAIKQAALIQASRLYERRTNVSGPLSIKEVDDVRLGWVAKSTDLGPDVLAVIAPYRKLWFAA